MGNNKTRNPKSPTIKDPPIELKIKPKACALCGKPYIPTGPWATYTPEPDPVPEYFGLAMDAARAIANDINTNGLHVVAVQGWYENGRGFLPMVHVTPQMFYELFDRREYEYRHEAKDRICLAGMIDGVEVLSWL